MLLQGYIYTFLQELLDCCFYEVETVITFLVELSAISVNNFNIFFYYFVKN